MTDTWSQLSSLLSWAALVGARIQTVCRTHRYLTYKVLLCKVATELVEISISSEEYSLL